MARRRLGVWLNDERVADIESMAKGGIRCSYTAATLDAHDQGLPILSCSLPLRTRATDGRWFFTGLLPEGQALQSMATMAGVATNDTFALLERFGRDVAGAVVISAREPGERIGGVEEYSTDTLDEAVASLPERPLDLHDDSELSLPGIQDKLLMVDLGKGQWGRPTGGRPSTHILKVEDRRFPGMADLEAACLGLARATGLTTIDAEVASFAGIPCLIVSRFDRDFDARGNVVRRIHQEDVCQALDLDPVGARGRGKYYWPGGATHRKVAGLLDKWSRDGEQALCQLLRVVTFTVAIGNADAHAKNIALLHRVPGAIELAPLYDTVPTVLWSQLKRREPALPIGPRVCDVDDLTGADILAEARLWNLDEDVARDVVRGFVADLDQAVRKGGIPDALEALVASQLERISTNL